MRPWASYLPSLCVGFLINIIKYKEIMVKQVNNDKAFRTVVAIEIILWMLVVIGYPLSITHPPSTIIMINTNLYYEGTQSNVSILLEYKYVET